jgi:hypothetical protein
MPRLLLIALALSLALFAGVVTANAQLPDPPSTITGSITDAAGNVPAGVRIEAYVGNNLCGESETVYTGDGASRVTVYVVDVVSADQTGGCGEEGDAVRIKVGERLAPRAAVWEAGLVRFDIIFGENVTPKPIPTFTPTPVPTITPTPTLNLSNGTPRPGTTGTPDASASPGGSPTGTADGITSSTPAPPSSGDSDGGGLPVWGAVVLAVVGLGLVGGGVGIYLTRRAAPV